MTRPHPWLPEAHDLGPSPTTTRWWRLRDRWRRFLHPHGIILDRLERLVAIECEHCGCWRSDPTTDCPRCDR